MNEQVEWFTAPADWEQAEPSGIQERTFKFAVRVIDALHGLSDNAITQVLVQQLLDIILIKLVSSRKSRIFRINGF